MRLRRKHLEEVLRELELDSYCAQEGFFPDDAES